MLNQKDQVQSTALFINIGFSIFAILVFVFLGSFIAIFLKSPHLYELLLWNTFFILLLIPFNHCEVVLQANFKYQQIFYAYFLRQGLFMIMVAVLVYGFPALPQFIEPGHPSNHFSFCRYYPDCHSITTTYFQNILRPARS